jgi:Barrel-sandwich domain of CusB or HlyD membrane-fusion
MKLLTEKLKYKEHLLRVIAILLIGMAFGYWLKGRDPAAIPVGNLQASSLSELDANESDKNTVYACPMMCVPPMETSGDCPVCGMELTPVEAGEKSDEPRIKLNPETIKLAQIQVAPVERKFVKSEIRLFGQIEYDPVHISYASVYVPGVIDKIYVKRAGQTVRWGDPLFDIYSPEIFFIEQEMLKALKIAPGYFAFNVSKSHVRKRAQVLTNRPPDQDKSSPELKAAYEALAAMRLKLILIGMEKKDIDELMKRGEPTGIATIYAQRSGTVIEQKAFEGTYVNTGTPVFAIANPKFVWAKLKAYESDYSWIRIKQEAHFQTDTYPGEIFKGKVAYIDPIFDTESRTFDVGVIFPDRAGRFRPSMYVRAVIFAKLTAGGKVAGGNGRSHKVPLVIPTSAPLITGKRAVVYVAVAGEEGIFEGREVVLGPRARDHYVVLEGLTEGEHVVVNGNFKIDSQVQILAKSSMMNAKSGHEAGAHSSHGVSQTIENKHRSGQQKGPTGMAMDKSGPAKHDKTPHDDHSAHKHQ